jgi:prephenate dehydrogenase
MDESKPALLPQSRVAIVGLGLMGGSLALALRGHCAQILGSDTDPAALTLARERHAIDAAIHFEDAVQCDLIILAAPIQAILEQIERLSQLPAGDSQGLILIDLGSTKTDIVAAMQALPAHYDPIGGHPMCGKEKSGIVHAEATLFKGNTFILTPLARTSRRAMRMAHEMIAAIDATPHILSAERHDALVAVTSHLPYLVATVLMQTAHSLHDEEAWTVAASGFRDTSRLAASDVTMMIDVLLSNRAHILDALQRYRAELDSLTQLIDSGDPSALRAALTPPHTRRAGLFV